MDDDAIDRALKEHGLRRTLPPHRRIGALAKPDAHTDLDAIRQALGIAPIDRSRERATPIVIVYAQRIDDVHGHTEPRPVILDENGHIVGGCT